MAFSATFLTNFSDRDLPIYEEVVRRFPAWKLYIEKDAYDSTGKIYLGAQALHSAAKQGSTTPIYDELAYLNRFWRIY